VALRFSVDTNIFLNVKNKEEPYYRYSKKILELIDDGEAEGVVSTMVVAELCAGYHEFNELTEKDEFLTQLRTNPNYKIVHLDLEVAEEAGRVRAMTHLRLPDAILVASSLIAGAPILVTHDDQLVKAQGLIRVLAAEQALKEPMADYLRGAIEEKVKAEKMSRASRVMDELREKTKAVKFDSVKVIREARNSR
jgi:predicted nucleic acid-binding protein